MKHPWSALLSLCLLWAALPVAAQAPAVKPAQAPPPTPPTPMREFRGVWVASVANIDWPSRQDLTTAQQQAELIALLDKAAQLHLNAIVLQVRPACDALYASSLEPWSEYLTGRQGQPPFPFYDPLAFAVAEAHKRGLELHAWFNPYRARHSGAKSELAPSHISRTHPEWVKTYGKSLWLDPGEPGVQDYTLSVILDVVRRYDIDGVHIDDYFYPYSENDAAGNSISFPDGPSWQRYRATGGSKSRDDWRRENVNSLIRRLYAGVKAAKPWVKVGISPFGIYRPGQPAQIKGFDPYEKLYADSRLWLDQGWLDYLSPQLYWKIEQKPQSFPVLLHWWASQNKHGRHLWPGLNTSQIGDKPERDKPDPWPPTEILYQIKTTRGIAGATGDIHFSMSPFLEDRLGIARTLQTGLYAQPALVPASPWLDATPPASPSVSVPVDRAGQGRTLAWQPTGTEPVWLWVVQTHTGTTWTTQILPGSQTTLPVAAPGASILPDLVAVSAVDRCGNQSKPTVVPE